ncbi:PaaI family thioesterase [Gordonia westfalica]|uniref:Acyl-coenzyme A thioesterase PaaI, contains HGG motif n=1 Tax=Gordonia westfalica TaxID=158898 RepID=A0A1H2KKW4_9ACTN|nr:acyl-CoA thioesterase domain-containing protein [Gordonia westfalica]SDU69263.1 Acyl-coenzyme A thioesterase PaaI, contains HGG motif [Gordonia westfalica]
MNSSSLATDESVPAVGLPIFDADRATASMHVRLESVDDHFAVFTQQVQDWQRGPDGAISLAALGPMVDAAVGSAPYLSAGGTRNFVMSSLSATFVAGVGDDDTVRAQSRRVDVDRRTDTVASVAEVHGGAGLIAVVTCRAVPVERVLRETVTVPTQHGLQTVDESGTRPETRAVGAPGTANTATSLRSSVFAAVLGLEVAASTTASVSGTWTTAPWMLNPFDTVQGGVVLAVVTEAAQLALAGITSADEVIGLTEISVDLLRSPAASTTYDWSVSFLRIGRRMVTMAVTVTGTDGREQARATCTAFRVRRD